MYKVNDFWRINEKKTVGVSTDRCDSLLFSGGSKWDSLHHFWEGGGFGRGSRDATDWMTCSIGEKSKQLISGG